MPRVIVDYCFLTDNEPGRTSEQVESEEESLTALVMKETLCGSVWAYALKSKSVGEDPWVTDQLVDDLCTIGLARERLVVKSDQEASIVEMQLEIAKKRGFADYGVGTGIENSKGGDSDSTENRKSYSRCRKYRAHIEVGSRSQHRAQDRSEHGHCAMDGPARRISDNSLPCSLGW